jgi:2-hydroxy-6-oxonona-2,4-dienedioate hydrolase
MTLIQYPLAINGTNTRVLESGEGPAVLFIHGLSTRADRWRDAIEECAQRGFRAIAFDLPGHGLADKAADFDYSSPALAGYALGVLDALGISNAHFIGTSLGGHIAALAALRAPERCISLYLVAPLGLAPLEPVVAEAIRTGVRNTSVEGVRTKLNNVFINKALATEALIVEESRINSSQGAVAALTALGDYIVASLNRDLVLEPVRVLSACLPVGLLWGEEDRMVPLSVGQAAAAALDMAPLPVMAGVGHAPYVEQPGEFTRRWADFAAAPQIATP